MAGNPADRTVEERDRGDALEGLGASMLQLEKPKTRADRAMTHKDAGGLSTVI